MICGADFHRAIQARWTASSLDTPFKALWPASVTASDYPALHDQEATPGQPWPYCVFQVSPSSTLARMTNTATSKWEVRDMPCEFRVHGKPVTGDTRSAKRIAAAMAANIINVFGGGPSVAPVGLTLDNGNFLIAQYQNDYGIRTGDDEYQWIVSYIFRLDVPVLIA